MTSILKVDELQDTSGNLIIKEDSNTITIGASGDTIKYSIGCNITLTMEQLFVVNLINSAFEAYLCSAQTVV